MLSITERGLGASIRRCLLALAALSVLALCAAPGQAAAAKLIGGHEQRIVARAFASIGSDRHRAIVSIRASTVSPSWLVVKSVLPQAGGTTSSAASGARLHSTYFHISGGHARPASPPHAARADLAAPFKVALVYQGSGSEAVNYQQQYRSVCAGAGGYVDTQTETVSPMSWSVRYVVDLDSVLSAVTGGQSTTLLPAVSFQASQSRLSAVEKLARTYVDQGCFNTPTTRTCTTVFHLSSAGADSDLGFDPGVGTEIGIPMAGRNSGACPPEYYTLGPSLWDGGAVTALAPRLGLLGLLGKALPGNPYAPIRVTWPSDSALLQTGFLVSPCQGTTATCSDQMNWHGTVQLRQIGRG